MKYDFSFWADVVTCVALFITVVGFGITIWRVVITARSVRGELLKITTIANLSSALTSMEELKDLQRKGDWIALPGRYSTLRRNLVAIRASTPNLSDSDEIAFQSAISTLVGIENQVDKRLEQGATPTNMAKLNMLISRDLDQLQGVLSKLATT